MALPQGEQGFKLNKSTESSSRTETTSRSSPAYPIPPAGTWPACVSDVFTAGPVDANSYQNTGFDQLAAEKNGRDTRLPFLPLSVGGGVGTLTATPKPANPLPPRATSAGVSTSCGHKDSLDKARRELLVRRACSTECWRIPAH